MNVNYNGALPSPPDDRDWRIHLCTDMPAGSAAQELPKIYNVSWLPDHKNQEYVNSCTSFAMAGIFECMWYKLTGRVVDFSTLFFYGDRMETAYTGEGFVMRDMAKTAHKHGDVTEDILGGNLEVPEAIRVFLEAYPKIKDLAHKLVQGYVRIYNEDEAKAFLLKYDIPLFISTQMKHINPLTKSTALHAMMCTGYTSTYFKCQNSWGKYNCPNPEIKFGNFKEVWGIIPMTEFKFTDIADDAWYADAVKRQAIKGVAKGYPDGTFKPDAPITRAEMMVILDRLDRLEGKQ